ncbi:hypothetical protein TNCV_294531 [Trichonephila clavipes]|nr:hypothetical protein TNCV_294531 [Trichonephila clavipes]
MATGSYLTPNHSRSQSEIQGDLHKCIEFEEEIRAEHLLFRKRRVLILKCVGCFGEASCWSKLSSDKQETLVRALKKWDKLPQQLLDNVVRRELHHTPRWTYPVLIPFFKVPADF